jgi:uncharacterized protein YjiS (DUF1127 family)
MPSISHRTSLGQAPPHRAESGSAALPAGLTATFSRLVKGIVHVIGAPIRWCAQRLEDWRELRHLHELDDHLLRDIGLPPTDVDHSTIFPSLHHREAEDPKGPPIWPTIF